ncbi:carotenoid oxygenase family protein [Sphingomonas sp. MMS24-J13]|uniref:carotenoid oxygenase family protein n=1 Tax=Sphingomonas sp. MMS24-J13 TaxID=3238686 RepID=UPI0038503B98
MTSFPDTVDYSGLNLPVRLEVEIQNLEVEGTIPPEIEGAFFRAVPDPAHRPMFDDDTALSGDGMISRFLFEDGHVDFSIKYVHTARYLAEKKARKALFGRYRNPFTDDPSVKDVDRTVANTTPIWHAGRLFMTKEDGRAYEVDPNTLETIGSWDYHGALKSQTMTAHARIDPETGEMFFFGYEAGGLCSEDIAYAYADKDGNLVSEQWFRAPYAAMMHDFAISKNYAFFPIFPTTTDIERLRAGGEHWAHRQDQESWMGVMPRYGKVEEMRWFRGPPGMSVFHIMNAFDDGEGQASIDMHISDTNAFPFMRKAGGIERNQWEIGGSLQRWTFDMTKPGETFEVRDLGPPGDMPRIPDALQGRPYRHGWYLSINPQGGPPLAGGPVGTAFNCLLRIEPGNGRIDAMGLPPGFAINEPIHIPSRDPDHEGWLMFVVDQQVGESDFASEVWIVDGGNVAAPPVAKIKVPVRLRPQVHGWWVPKDQLAQAASLKEAA